MKYIILVQLVILTFGNAHGESRRYAMEKDPKPVFVHAVYFWLHDTMTDAQKEEFISLLKSLKEIRSVKNLHVGYPAGTPRTVVDNTYDIALIVTFKDKAGHDIYQADQIHKEAIMVYEDWIRDIRIYDMVTQKGPGMQYE